ncbi:GGDEF domain-containing protein [Methylocaldum sp.]|uniref:GGDEF domain-containing protein n=1 Tax=Methylocaldum sp. TaxID=1969727 RepID=UPI002D4DCC20|nr:GGDEF domain-containing protein [Methylocaldum sp.]HYE37716.1 GGDEF domain-containing protein [Methylocaldum sp.]
MNNPKLDDPQYWKAKYATLADELKESKEKTDEREKLLCRTIIRLTLATNGLDPAIDPHLIHIRDLLRKGVSSEKLRTELNAVSETLLREVKGKDGNNKSLKRDGGMLFRFVKQLATNDEERKAIALLEQRVDRGEIADWKWLFSELQEILRCHTLFSASLETEAPKPGFFGRLLQTNKRPVEEKVEMGPVRDRLLLLLDVIELPLNFSQQAEGIKSRLKSEADAEELQALLNEAIDFLSDVKSFIQKEQLEIEYFLAGLTGRLNELEHDAVGMDANAQSFARNRVAEDSSFADQFEDLRSRMEVVTDVDQLKLLVNSGLNGLLERLHTSRNKELNQLRDSTGRLGELARRLQELELEANDLRSKLRLAHDMALRDSLTSLPNRMAYEDRITQEITRSQRFQQPMSLLLWDIDHFKSINDRFGHSAGDKVLVTVAQELDKSIRQTDFVARLGGEEFAMILCGADVDAARRIADQIRQRISRCGFNSQGRPVQVTVSCGVSQVRNGDTPESLFERADKGLYEAKKTGRDRCVMS